MKGKIVYNFGIAKVISMVTKKITIQYAQRQWERNLNVSLQEKQLNTYTGTVMHRI